jgi:hypothetical protein
LVQREARRNPTGKRWPTEGTHSFAGIGFSKEMTSKKQSKRSILVKCSRLFKGTIADVRSHVVEKAKQQGKDLQISVLNLGVQCFSPDAGVLLVQKQFTSKRGTKPYQLISFFWKQEETKPSHAPKRVEVPQAEFSF